jgi:hypothetical protein
VTVNSMIFWDVTTAQRTQEYNMEYENIKEKWKRGWEEREQSQINKSNKLKEDNLYIRAY